jgi:bacterioferritin-associated ferredoxin
MILCSCFVVSDNDVRRSAKDEISFQDFRRSSKLGTNCGRCVPEARKTHAAASASGVASNDVPSASPKAAATDEVPSAEDSE